ncbi:SURF1 family protein [Methylomonas sp. LL1]|uniref:SURF1 family protein n=1 Tax=Methylomonas sp. LL1 TaxID=2785785 RepID=UPI0018C430C8|nr:SURF1 family protein [Methylomonas sp. LL1]QPK65329.1 SURF1 family protein [Methylomonas sp. LL1]
MTIKLFNRQFQFSLLGLSLYVLLMALLCSLGFWQLDRSEQKKQLLMQQQLALDAGSVDLNRQSITDVDSVRYQKATLTGRYDNAHQFLLDNQIIDGKNGYFVLTPFFPDGPGRAVLINRGWLALGNNRNQLPNVEIQTKQAQVVGRINHFPSVGIKLKGAEIPTDNWPSVVQVIDSKVLSQKLGYELASFQIELEPAAEQGYKREWKINTPIPPEKHLAYAVQWFGLALTLTALFIWISIKKSSEHTA